MSESPSDPGQPTKGQDSIDRRAWSSARQWRAVGVAAAVAVIAVLALWLGGRVFGPHEAPAAGPPAPPGTFRATAQQLKTLTFETVALHAFVSEELTEGKIAVNADRATESFGKIVQNARERLRTAHPAAPGNDDRCFLDTQLGSSFLDVVFHRHSV